LINVGPLKDFSYGLRANADPNATGNAKQSNYELVSSWYFTSVFC
jgi:cleavage and polyadenylation specificity factor subunit 1